jgi:hypothetical protein
MDNQPKPVVVIPSEKAVFRLDKDGKWRSGNEKFRNRKIIKYFHSMIKKDSGGYYLEQEHVQYIEKVYFPYEDTALFALRIIEKDGLVLCLNTGENLRLDPEKLFIKDDSLYLKNEDDIIKLSDNALLTLSGYMDGADDQYIIRIDGERHLIQRVESEPTRPA